MVAPAIIAAVSVSMFGLVGAEGDVVTVDRFLPYTSTVPANVGQRVGLFLREKMSRELAAQIESGGQPNDGVVLFVHGGSVPSIPDYDLGPSTSFCTRRRSSGSSAEIFRGAPPVASESSGAIDINNYYVNVIIITLTSSLMPRVECR